MKYLFLALSVCFSLLCIGVFYSTLAFFEQRKPVKTAVRVIAQTGPIKEGLKTDCLAELLDLSFDRPKCLSSEKVEEVLRKSPCIQKVSASYPNPETLYIDYILRNPIFALIDLDNTALDLEGYLFPLTPYFTPKKLPELYLGLKEIPPFEKPLQGKEIALATDLYRLLKEEIGRIDLSRIDETSLGKKEIVVILKLSNGMRHILRLSTTRYKEELDNYQALRSTLREGDFTIDLRIPQLGYVTQLTDERAYFQ
ncbi:MAG: hypothetical protein AAGE99_03630 [Chlamydiota bacterium]